MARHVAPVATVTAALSAAAQVPQAGQCATEGGITQSVDPALRIRQLEMENGRLLMRLSLLLKQTHLDGTHDGRKWRHKYMVELLRRASLERRNEQLARRLQQLEASAGAQERQPLRETLSELDVAKGESDYCAEEWWSDAKILAIWEEHQPDAREWRKKISAHPTGFSYGVVMINNRDYVK